MLRRLDKSHNLGYRWVNRNQKGLNCALAAWLGGGGGGALLAQASHEVVSRRLPDGSSWAGKTINLIRYAVVGCD